jgi:hypothetical protein
VTDIVSAPKEKGVLTSLQLAKLVSVWDHGNGMVVEMTQAGWDEYINTP